MYSLFRRDTGTLYYLPGDSHWNENGKKAWLGKVNAILEDLHTQKYDRP
jgi:hypothetical protein